MGLKMKDQIRIQVGFHKDIGGIVFFEVIIFLERVNGTIVSESLYLLTLNE